ncbi:hypothetical protein PLESTB_000205800 [Pleodorina starrii]|uniref:RING-type domain-containing protein n=1 Tax=Pleodorina starrii TaxID=330485 RepID=A0A9W6BBW2_9CHLO|nr:hypothetical protein PLESTM_000325700 [Pleodorina starrii]GLC49314.1 hypothetical protein PLESTB_000205800 [Pleodorina starrii]GLC73428.1 hypothetical protein PLESTF_001374400 [Pleodorina starrii]
MCVVCWQEFDDCNPPFDLGCGHYGCESCRAAISCCPVCHAAIVTSPFSTKEKTGSMQGTKTWPTPRRRHRLGDELLGDLLDDDHVAPTVLGSADTAISPRVHMLERAPSSAAGSVASRAQHGTAVSARQVARGSMVAGRTVLGCAVLPAVRAGCFVSRTLLSTTCRAVTSSGLAIAHAASSLARFVSAPRCSVVGFDGDRATGPRVDDPSEAQSHTQTEKQRGRPRGRRRQLRALLHQRNGAVPEPVTNVVRGRITLRDCRNTRIRIEYCRDCVVVASRLESVELLLVCCQRVKLVLRDCPGLVLRELQCTNMGDFVRRGCPNFAHEIVCLRCACKPMMSSSGSIVTY